MKVSVIVPTLDESAVIEDTLSRLQPLRARGHEVILADGGSGDGTRELAAPLVDAVIDAPRGRAQQMNAGARAGGGELLLFLHADTLLPEGGPTLLEELLRGDALWGRFDVRLSGRVGTLRMVETLINLRSRLSGIATGDQAIFVRREAFERVGGFPEIPLMEDVALSRRLKKLRRPLCLRNVVVTSSRRWEEGGVWRTILLMWWLRAAYALGVDPHRLARWYR